MADDSSSRPARYANGRFGPGNPGRPYGALGRASRRSTISILEHFERHQERMLDMLANSDFLECKALYLKIVARALPKPMDVGADGEILSGEEIAAALAHAQVLYTGAGDRRAALADLEAILTGQRINGENTDKTVEINVAAG